MPWLDTYHSGCMAVYSGGSLRNKINPYRKEKQKEFENIEKIVEKMTRENNHGKSGRIPLFLLIAGIAAFLADIYKDNADSGRKQQSTGNLTEVQGTV